jgi:hypothetical protein
MASAGSDHGYTLPICLQLWLLMHTQRNQFVRIPGDSRWLSSRGESRRGMDSSPWLACTFLLDAAADSLHTTVVDACFLMRLRSELLVTTRRIRARVIGRHRAHGRGVPCPPAVLENQALVKPSYVLSQCLAANAFSCLFVRGRNAVLTQYRCSTSIFWSGFHRGAGLPCKQGWTKIGSGLLALCRWLAVARPDGGGPKPPLMRTARPDDSAHG